MKKALKIIGWTFFSIVMVLLLAFGIACYILFTPSRLTPIVNRIVGNYVTCDYEVGRVELTFFSTFPRVGVRIDRLTLVNPVEDAQNDTVLHAQNIVATVNLKQLLFNNNLIITEASLDNADVNYFVAADGTSNFDIFVSSPDTVVEEVPDTAAFSLPFNDLRVDRLHVQAHRITYNDKQSEGTYVELNGGLLEARAANWNEMYLCLQAADLYACLSDETYANHIPMRLNAPLQVQLDSMRFGLDKAFLDWGGFAMTLDGTIALNDTVKVNMTMQTEDTWAMEPLLTTLPQTWVESVKQFKPQGDLSLTASVQGLIGDSVMPVVTVHQLHADLWNSQFDISGTISDMEADMCMEVDMAMDMNVPDFKQFFPDDMIIQAKTKGTAQATIRMSDLDNGVLTKGQVNLAADHLTFRMDTTIDAELVKSDICLRGTQMLADKAEYHLTLKGSSVAVRDEDIKADMDNARLDVSMVSGKKIKAKLSAEAFRGKQGSDINGKTNAITLEAAAKYNPENENFLLKWNPLVRVDLREGKVEAPDLLPDVLHVPSIDFNYSNHRMTIHDSRIEIGNSDLGLHGEVENIEDWLRHKGVLEGELNIVSDHCDANQLLAWFSDDNGSEEPEPEEQTPAMVNDVEQTQTAETDPFLVPVNVNLALHTHMREVDVFNQNAKDLKGGIYLHDGTLILDEVGFICKAAKMQLTAMYRTPRKNHLYAGFDYHMIDVDIDELLTMIPNLEEMVPMLRSFKGDAEFHLAAETYLKSNYEPKMSTLRGAASLTGKDLVVLDSETFDQISKLLLFKKKTENKIDSLNAEITIYKNEIDVYPLCVQMDNYMVALGGRHNTNMTFNYDINVLKPVYLGVNVSGTLDDLNIKLAPCKFAQDFRPHWYQKVDNQSRELRERIKQSMERNVRIK